jgi:hypothetical protein
MCAVMCLIYINKLVSRAGFGNQGMFIYNIFLKVYIMYVYNDCISQEYVIDYFYE